MSESPAQGESNQDQALRGDWGWIPARTGGSRLGKTPEQGACGRGQRSAEEWQWRRECLGPVLKRWDTEDTVMW